MFHLITTVILEQLYKHHRICNSKNLKKGDPLPIHKSLRTTKFLFRGDQRYGAQGEGTGPRGNPRYGAQGEPKVGGPGGRYGAQGEPKVWGPGGT